MTMITPSYLGETIEYSSLHACRSTLEDPTFWSGGQPASAAGEQAGVPPGAIELPLPSVHTNRPSVHTHNRGNWTRLQVYSGAHSKPSTGHRAPIVRATVAGHWPTTASSVAVAASAGWPELSSELPQARLAMAQRLDKQTTAQTVRALIAAIASDHVPGSRTLPTTGRFESTSRDALLPAVTGALPLRPRPRRPPEETARKRNDGTRRNLLEIARHRAQGCVRRAAADLARERTRHIAGETIRRIRNSI